MTLAALLCSGQKRAPPVPADEFVGVWKLVSFERRGWRTVSSTHPMSNAMGDMTAQFINPDRPKFRESGSAQQPEDAVRRLLAPGFIARALACADDHAYSGAVDSAFQNLCKPSKGTALAQCMRFPRRLAPQVTSPPSDQG
jgi:hypothetical protein